MTEIRAGAVYIIGVGPGDPELMTIRAKRIIDAADLIIYTGSLLGDDGFRDVKPTAQLVDSAGLHLDQIVGLMRTAAFEGQVVARVHDGDPAIFGALSEQMAPLEAAGIPVEVVPGVTAAFAAAAALKAELTIPELAQTVILTRMEGRTPVPNGEKLRDLARHGTTLVLYLSIGLIDRVVPELRAGYPADTPVVVVQRAWCADQAILRGTLADITAKVKAAKMRAQALIMVGPVFRPDLRRTWDRRSKLYDPEFSHRFRRAARGRPVGGGGGHGMTEELLTALEAALAQGDTMVIVRAGAATAEVVGGPLRRGPEWLTLGDEAAGASHVHLRLGDVRALRYREAEGRNAALDVLGPDGAAILSVSFRKTNPRRGEGFDAERLAAVRARFGHLGNAPA